MAQIYFFQLMLLPYRETKQTLLICVATGHISALVLSDFLYV